MITRTAILALSLAFGAPALAAPATDSVTATVRIADLDLASADDRAILDARVKHAARRLCRSDLRGTSELALQTQCVASALASAQSQADRAVAGADRGIQLAALSVKAAR